MSNAMDLKEVKSFDGSGSAGQEIYIKLNKVFRRVNITYNSFLRTTKNQHYIHFSTKYLQSMATTMASMLAKGRTMLNPT